MQTGTLRFSVAQAELIRDTEMMGKMDPFVEVRVAGQEYKSEVCKNGGKKPEWSDSFEIRVMNLESDQIEITINDQDMFSVDHVGSVTYQVSSFCVSTEEHNNWYYIGYKGEIAGRIRIVSQWTPT